MTKLFIVGLGLNDAQDITLKGLEAIKNSEKIYLEGYTSLLQCSVNDLEKAFGCNIEVVDRNFVETELEKLFPLKVNTALLIIGDPFSATTHSALVLGCKEKKQDYKIIHNTSIMNAVGEVGLELYKYGMTVSIPYPVDGVLPMSAFERIINNGKNSFHTLVLLDIKADEQKFMTINEGIDLLFGMGLAKHNKIIGVARLGSNNQIIKYGMMNELEKIDFGPNPHCIIIPSSLNIVEEEMVNSHA